MSDTEEIITLDDPRAATYREDIKGWVSRDGLFFGDNPDSERAARWSGSTHTKCECGVIEPKGYTKCSGCREKSKQEKWEARPIGKWDGKALLYSETLDRYYSSIEEAEDDAEWMECTAPFNFIICEPIKLRHISDEYWAEELDLEDGMAELPKEVLEAMKALNDALDKMDPVTWEPGRYRLPNVEDMNDE